MTRTFAVAVENQSDDLSLRRLARRTNRLKCLLIFVGLPILMWACSGDPTSLTSPTSPTFTVSGVVFERTPTETKPVEAAWVEESNSHRGTQTDKNGFYSIAGLPAGSTSVSASASSYYVETISFVISGDVKKDIEIVKVEE
jgi:hypothetical protein